MCAEPAASKFEKHRKGSEDNRSISLENLHSNWEQKGSGSRKETWGYFVVSIVLIYRGRRDKVFLCYRNELVDDGLS